MTGVEIAVFARTPVAGQAKTRLIPLLGAKGAAQLQAHLLAAAVDKAAALPSAACSLWVAGDTGHPAITTAATRHCIPVEAQVGDDLGQRMHHAMGVALSRHAGCLIIGTDCPALTTAHLVKAAAALQSHDVVLGPAEDGGYVLIGLTRPRPELFAGIAWGSSTVLAATQRRIRDAGLRLYQLPPLPDLDTPDDYRHAQAQGWLPA